MALKKTKVCHFCVNQKDIDYKDAATLQKFLTPYKSIVAKKRTGNCALHQRKVTKAIKQARIMGLLPFVGGR
ncbi:MAG: 30S ribosomal protein S18 [Parcubacteria group bacterium]|nr:30S ribosomal protein S18 [Parcubacteria group bacterium]|tara:strand:+ start:355 stop:570 length:216 start_codon:yes stop_codon:yes gene_type:complete